MSIYFMLSTSFLENIIFLGSMYFFIGMSFKKAFWSPRAILFNVASTLIVLWIQMNSNNSLMPLFFLLAALQYILIIKAVTHHSFPECFSAVLCTYLFQFMFQMLSIITLLILFPDFDLLGTSLYTLLTMMISLALTLLVYYFFPVRKLYLTICKKIRLICLITLIILLFLTSLSGMFEELNIPNLVTQLALQLLIFLVFFSFLLGILRSQKQEQALRYYQTYLPILDNMILSVRKSQHNYNNMIQSISALPQTTSDYASLVNTIEKYSAHFQKDSIPSQLLSLENKLLVALLYCKYETASANDIELSFQINRLTYNSRANEFTVVDIAGILLDNGIEASQPGDTIFVVIGDNDTPAFSISVKNPGPEATQDFVKQIFSEHYTSKKDGISHGLGLPSLKTMVTKSHGHIEVENETIENEQNEPIRYLVLRVVI